MSRLPVVLLALVPLAACSGTVDTPKVERYVAKQLGRQVNDKVTVRCPDNVDWREGGEFHCFAKDSSGQRARVTITMENDDGDYTWSVG